MRDGKVIICMDYDGVITDPLAIIKHLNQQYKMDILPWQVDDYDLNKVYGLTIDWLDRPYGVESLFHLHKFAPWEQYASAVIDYLMEHPSVELHIVSARGEEGANASITMFEKNVKHMPNFIFLGNDKDKKETLEKLGCDLMIEDSPRNITELSMSGLYVMTFDRPYNKNAFSSWRVKTWLDVKEVVDTLIDNLLTREKYRGY